MTRVFEILQFCEKKVRDRARDVINTSRSFAFRFRFVLSRRRRKAQSRVVAAACRKVSRAVRRGVRRKNLAWAWKHRDFRLLLGTILRVPVKRVSR